jgi:hypothetical protein
MGGITFLLGTSPSLSTGVIRFSLALVSFPVCLHWLPQAMVFWAFCSTLLWCTKNNAPLFGLNATRSFLGLGHRPPPPYTAPIPPSGLASPSSSMTKVVELNPIKDALAYLERFGIIKFYHCKLDFSTGCVDGKLITTATNLKASRLWEGQLHLAIKDATLRFLFKNKGDTYNSHGFEMLTALNAFCCPDSVANTFSSLLSIFNKLKGNDEPIVAFWSQFDSLILEMVQCKVVIPPLLLVILFLRALHSHYSDTLLSNLGFNTSLWKLCALT